MAEQSTKTDQASGRPLARRTRRQLLAGGTGALAAVLTAEAIARPAPAQAANGDTVILGASNSETSGTVIDNTDTSSGAVVLNLAAFGLGTGLVVDSDSGIAVVGDSNTGDGVVGSTSSATANGVLGTNQGAGTGVLGTSSTGDGVLGTTGGASAAGVAGRNTGGGDGVTGTTDSAKAAAVHGTNTGSGTGVLGECTAGSGVVGTTASATARGVLGMNTGGGTAVFGQSGSGDAVGGSSSSGNGVTGTSSSGVGVFGLSGSGDGVVGVSTTAVGVTGQSDSGDGVSGTSSSGDAVSGASDTGHAFFGVAGGLVAAVDGKNVGSGVGVRGECAAGLGVLAIGSVALEVHGPAVFTRSGVLTVAAGKSSATQTGVALSTSSLVLASLQQDHAGVWVRSAVPNVAGSSFTVHLSKAVAASMSVAWFVVN